ncbi:hypothetical protein Pcinc_004784 [Petrolisthes cinctipes]|uniref:Uncharacterized protein n=1 Tax=Petrolisthes cinctipes TaxID=88211 RepID=A0AAE1GG88_PETCI|nr:hypothetical protein Pcinc_004784 [Petrolisthes cinctipes]
MMVIRRHWVGSLLHPSLLVLVMTVVTGAVVYQVRSGTEYVDQSFEHATSSFLIVFHYIYAVPTDGVLALLECTRACVCTSGCTSSVMFGAQGRCALTKLNRCNTPTQPLVSMPGVQDSMNCCLPTKCLGLATALVLPTAERIITVPTKTNSVIGLGSYCGRANCAGASCDICSVFCWQLNPQITDGSVESFFYPTGETRAGGVLSYQEQLDRNYTTISLGRSHKILLAILRPREE